MANILKLLIHYFIVEPDISRACLPVFDDILVNISQSFFTVFLFVIIESYEPCKALIAFKDANFFVKKVNLFANILSYSLGFFLVVERGHSIMLFYFFDEL